MYSEQEYVKIFLFLPCLAFLAYDLYENKKFWLEWICELNFATLHFLIKQNRTPYPILPKGKVK